MFVEHPVHLWIALPRPDYVRKIPQYRRFTGEVEGAKQCGDDDFIEAFARPRSLGAQGVHEGLGHVPYREPHSGTVDRGRRRENPSQQVRRTLISSAFASPRHARYALRPRMRLSQILISTLRDDPADAEIPSHRLLARAGLIVKIAAGVYTFAPLMWRSVKKFAQIVRDELDREGANEVMLPIIQPKELWVSSGRWDRYVNDGIMFTLKDRKGSDMCLGPTHEEVMTAFVNTQVNSYKQLPVNCYQIQDKFRDEIRPRFGLMRGREFIMMDAYSFDTDVPSLDVAYFPSLRKHRSTRPRIVRTSFATSGSVSSACSQNSTRPLCNSCANTPSVHST